MHDWAIANPHLAFALMISVIAALATTIKFLLARHSEFVAFNEHMKREENEVWPTVQEQQQAMKEQMATNHLEGMTMLRDHGARITALEKRMPDGQLKRIEDLLSELITRKE